MTEREFPTAVVATAATGVSLCDPSAFHEFVEWYVGYSVFTHQLGRVGEQIAESLKVAIPWFAGFDADSINPENYRDKLELIESALGATLQVRRCDSPPDPVCPFYELEAMIAKRGER